MSRDGFTSGFLAGAFVGGLVGGILGAVLASRREGELLADDNVLSDNNLSDAEVLPRRRQMRATTNESIEMDAARRSLEDKIAQLNATIDDVRKQLGNVNGNSSQTVNERSLSQDV
ncbi:hypothetical protein B6N60_01665 [Richelia sinica FACHB-800]|uniref:Gas vesicle protein n=1 Tax=Richelia sinica FACHB-800 TaxID=1357546 RepID=A0A975Y4A7_9NOST|nr:hypothetical protein [Richelia sinica]MBD2666320.1 hypothetical protein [Richelia sinica FACHB-800]QXE22978.1 hypothetical protein B6N60_01665 [Richelia sinica FACHB-800]